MTEPTEYPVVIGPGGVIHLPGLDAGGTIWTSACGLPTHPDYWERSTAPALSCKACGAVAARLAEILPDSSDWPHERRHYRAMVARAEAATLIALAHTLDPPPTGGILYLSWLDQVQAAAASELGSPRP